ncbi:hypothetical protein [Phyllobacterium endophyticum]|uniref:Glycosyltransferase RgtA/B/C/D-like domain-containing protein n=1 Tax=Phyllobacterium endophyticum TaxID=1149773 RepID=A0A2P7AWB9_9HYPH|nr:hypothetical protein [Phyllobacterium endophyticum]MBB3235107.1 hypothetical protein [Phyllobacterium endophyticum]PSH58501.1 hypothetical protein CU100_12990 [Phyllobacterium endophyticum]TYR39178.1 hypothetical protein FY050_24830 [Phyllobacterium endophyticum]
MHYRSNLRSVLVVVLIALCALYVSLLWNTVPYYQSSGGIALWHSGFAESLARSGPFAYPPHLAFPQGAPIALGASLSYLQYILMALFGMGGLDSYSVAGFLFAVAAVTGCYFFARGLGVSRPLSIALAVLFLSQAFFSLHVIGYGAVGFGFGFLPAFCAVFRYVCNNHEGARSTIILNGVLLTFTMIFFAFLDGYSFVMAVAIGVALLVSQSLFERGTWRIHLWNLALLTFASGIAFLLYNAYVPAVGLPGYPLNIFAFLSVHIPSLFRPTAGYSILYDFLDLSKVRLATEYVGAGLGNHESAFLSITALIILVASFFIRIAKVWRIAALLLIVGGGLMAIGPVLPESNGEFQGSKLVSAERAPLITMPTYPLYTSVPGLDQMRATYRWLAVVKLGFWILVCLFCGYLASRFRHGQAIAFAMIVLMTLETSRPPLGQWLAGKKQYDMANSLQRDLTADIETFVPPGSKLLVLPITNDFVVHAVAAKAGVYTYNVAGDKNLLIAASERPAEITGISEAGACLLNQLFVAAERGQIDFLAFRMFDSHRGLRGWIWPPSKAEIEENASVALQLSKDVPPALVSKGKFFWFVDAHKVDRSMTKSGCPQS